MTKKMSAPRFYPIVDNLADLQTFTQLGYGWIQWRVKDSTETLLKEALHLHRLHRRHPNQKILINDDAEAAIALGFDGVHLGQEDLDSAVLALPTLTRRAMILGISTHSKNEIERAVALHPSYIAIGPVAPSTSKPSLPSAGLQEMFQLRNYLQPRFDGIIVAIGGIRANLADMLFHGGFDTVAFIQWCQELASRQIAPAQLWHSLAATRPIGSIASAS